MILWHISPRLDASDPRRMRESRIVQPRKALLIPGIEAKNCSLIFVEMKSPGNKNMAGCGPVESRCRSQSLQHEAEEDFCLKSEHKLFRVVQDMKKINLRVLLKDDWW